jgi:hypothetical protein
MFRTSFIELSSRVTGFPLASLQDYTSSMMVRRLSTASKVHRACAENLKLAPNRTTIAVFSAANRISDLFGAAMTARAKRGSAYMPP